MTVKNTKIDPAGLRECRLQMAANRLFRVDEFAYRATVSTVPGRSKATLTSLARKSEKGLGQAIEYLKQWTPAI